MIRVMADTDILCTTGSSKSKVMDSGLGDTVPEDVMIGLLEKDAEALVKRKRKEFEEMHVHFERFGSDAAYLFVPSTLLLWTGPLTLAITTPPRLDFAVLCQKWSCARTASKFAPAAQRAREL